MGNDAIVKEFTIATYIFKRAFIKRLILDDSELRNFFISVKDEATIDARGYEYIHVTFGLRLRVAKGCIVFI